VRRVDSELSSPSRRAMSVTPVTRGREIDALLVTRRASSLRHGGVGWLTSHSPDPAPPGDRPRARRGASVAGVLEIDIPHFGSLSLVHVVCDVNGTLALDGRLEDGVAAALRELDGCLEVHLLTSDTHGRQDDLDRELGRAATRIPSGATAAEFKARYVENLGSERCAAIGNGRNDRLMLRAARLAVAVLGQEGAAKDALTEADIVVTSGRAAIELLLHPQRLVASLRG
jgi:soluble P-type ATPase